MHDPVQDHELSGVLAGWRGGSPDSQRAAMPQVYDQLRRIARRMMASNPHPITLQPTALVHDTYLKLNRLESLRFVNRAHFYATAARVMRQVLLDSARRRQRLKRGGQWIRTTWHEDAVSSAPQPDAVALEACLRELEAQSPEQARVLELRYFCGLSIEETGRVMELSAATVLRRWRLARAFLYQRLKDEPCP